MTNGGNFKKTVGDKSISMGFLLCSTLGMLCSNVTYLGLTAFAALDRLKRLFDRKRFCPSVGHKSGPVDRQKHCKSSNLQRYQ